MKKLINLLNFLILLIIFKAPAFATSLLELPEEIVDQIFKELIIDNPKNAIEIVGSQKNVVFQNVIKLMRVNKWFYQIIFNIIDKIPDCWDYFELMIDESSNNKKFNQVIHRCKMHLKERHEKNLKENQIFPPLFVSICFNEVTLGPERVLQLGETLAPFFTFLKRLRFVGVRILPKISLLSLKNALARFHHLTAIDAQAKKKKGIVIMSNGVRAWQKFTIHISEKLFLALEEFSFFHNCLQSLTLNFNCLQKFNNDNTKYTQSKQTMLEDSNHDFYTKIITSYRLFNMLLNFSNLKRIELSSADLQLRDGINLKPILSQLSEKLEYLNLHENENIDNFFLEDAFSKLRFKSLKVLNVSKTKINQDCQIFAQCKNLSRLIMRGCSNLEPTILEKLSQYGNLVNTLEELDISGSNLCSLPLHLIQNDLSKFKKLKLINLERELIKF